MQTILPSEIKKGMVLMVEGTPHVLEDFHTSGTAKTKHKLHARLRNLTTGRFGDRVIAENERLEVAELDNRRVTFSYKQGDMYAFLDAQTFEELNLNAEQVGDRHLLLKEDVEYKAVFLEGKLLDISVPAQLPMKVVQTAPAMKGGTDNTWKEAILETGLQIMVPPFIETGEVVRVDTAERKYLGKETAEK